MSNAYLVLTPYNATALTSDAPPPTSLPNRDLIGNVLKPATVMPLSSWSFELEQTLVVSANMGGTAGVSPGKIAFDGLSLIRNVDNISPTLLTYSANGTPFSRIDILTVKPGANQVYLQYTFKLAAVRTISLSFDGDQPNETVTFDYGGYQIHYVTPHSDGTTGKNTFLAGWNRILNVADISDTPL